MSKTPFGSGRPAIPQAEDGGDVAAELAGRMAADLVFVMKFLGESQSRLQSHFHDFILTELADRGVDGTSHPLIAGFAETHALTMRDFVFAGLSLTHQFRLAEIEALMGDAGSLLKVDIWDDLKRHIASAERDFLGQLPGLKAQLDIYRPVRKEPGA